MKTVSPLWIRGTSGGFLDPQPTHPGAAGLLSPRDCCRRATAVAARHPSDGGDFQGGRPISLEGATIVLVLVVVLGFLRGTSRGTFIGGTLRVLAANGLYCCQARGPVSKFDTD